MEEVKKKRGKNKGGRPRIEIDIKSFEKLCELQCTRKEIASFFDCSDDTIEKFCKRTYKTNFREIYEHKRGKGKIALRRYQFRLAEKNAAMAIWLGKQYLGQKDEQIINQNVAPIVIKDDLSE